MLNSNVQHRTRSDHSPMMRGLTAYESARILKHNAKTRVSRIIICVLFIAVLVFTGVMYSRVDLDKLFLANRRKYHKDTVEDINAHNILGLDDQLIKPPIIEPSLAFVKPTSPFTIYMPKSELISSFGYSIRRPLLSNAYVSQNNDCHFTTDGSFKTSANAVMVDSSFQPSTMWSTMNETDSNPLYIMFYFEPLKIMHPHERIRSRFDIIVEPYSPIKNDVVDNKKSAPLSIPVTMTCPWMLNKQQDDWLSTYFTLPAVDFNSAQHLFYPNTRATPNEHEEFVQTLVKSGDITTDQHPRTSGDIFNVTERILTLHKYKFTFITESVIQPDWMEMEFSQAFAAGSVPVYLGAPNASNFAPGGHKSYIDIIADGWIEKDPHMLLDYLRNMTPEQYANLTSWKQDKSLVSDSFKEKLNQCVYYAENRICNAVSRVASH